MADNRHRVPVSAPHLRACGAAKLVAMGTDPELANSATVVSVKTVDLANMQLPRKGKKSAKKKKSSYGVELPPDLNIKLMSKLGLVVFMHEQPFDLQEKECAHLSAITHGKVDAALAKLRSLEWSPLLVLDFPSTAAAMRVGVASEEKLRQRWEDQAVHMKAVMDTGIIGQPRGDGKSDVPERLW